MNKEEINNRIKEIEEEIAVLQDDVSNIETQIMYLQYELDELLDGEEEEE